MRCRICDYCSHMPTSDYLNTNGYAEGKLNKRGRETERVVRIDELTGDPLCTACTKEIYFTVLEYPVDEEPQEEYTSLETENNAPRSEASDYQEGRERQCSDPVKV